MPDRLDLYNYELPPHLIAQQPLADRDQARMMMLSRGNRACSHRFFHELPGLLPPGAVLVVNNTRVLPRRLPGHLPGGGRMEALLVGEEAPGRWKALIKNARRIKPGMMVRFAGGQITAQAIEAVGMGQWLLEFSDPPSLPALLERHGLAPLPPYIRRNPDDSGEAGQDRADYQTPFARVDGAIAAPTAGFHFTPRVLDRLRGRGIPLAEVTLHVGVGTFAKIQTDDPARHAMQSEWWEVPAATAAVLKTAREEGRPVIAVGTTTVRALESWWATGGREGQVGWSDLFIRPPHRFGIVNGLITNFHQPRSTLLLLVAAFHGREGIMAAYREAIGEGYRFFSYGDCMAILPAPVRDSQDTQAVRSEEI